MENPSSSPVAGRAYIENENGERVPARLDGGPRKSAAPSKPAGADKSWLQEFELTERSGKVYNSNDLLGKPYVASFFFSTCPTICTRQNEHVAELQKMFKGQPVRLVSITCDPEVDQPEVLSLYADKFGADQSQWLFFTGELDYLRRVGAEIFFVPLDRRFHAEKFILIDADGKIFGSYDWNVPEQFNELKSDLDKMIKAGGRLPKPPTKNESSELDFDSEGS